MKKLIVFLFLVPLFANAQVTTHTVAAKETLYSLAREYNIHPRELAAFNNLSVQTNLAIGQVIKIPATRKMAPLASTPATAVPEKTQTAGEEQPKKKEIIKPIGTVLTDPTTKKPIGITESIVPQHTGNTPIYHKVAPKETLYHISTLYNKVPVADLKKWNNLSGDALKEGTNLIVGYTNTTTPAMQEAAAVKQPAVTKAEEVVEKKGNPVPAVPDTKKAVANPVTGTNFNGGFFKSFFNEQSQKKEEKGQAGIFKSTSGWEDGKYYCLHNTAQAGSIVKITNPATSKSIYAKVLDVIPDLKQNGGLIISLSNAAAEELGAGTGNFDCTLQY